MKACHKSSYYNEEEMNDSFKKKIKSFLSFNFFIFILMLFGIKLSILWKISVMWGAYLAFTLWRKGSYSCDRDEFRDKEREYKNKQYGRPKRPEWKDKDLV